MKELITNGDGRLSTTAFIQFGGALLMAAILVYAVYLDRSYVGELYITFAVFMRWRRCHKRVCPSNPA